MTIRSPHRMKMYPRVAAARLTSRPQWYGRVRKESDAGA
jgi:hypothetical protein